MLSNIKSTIYKQIFDYLTLQSNDECFKQKPTFYYMAIGSAPHIHEIYGNSDSSASSMSSSDSSNSSASSANVNTDNKISIYPKSCDRHEYPDYIKEYPFNRKTLILIDPETDIPLAGSEHTLTLSKCVKDESDNNKNVYELYHSVEVDSEGYSILEVHVIRQCIYLDENRWHPEEKEYLTDREFIAQIVETSLDTHRDSMFLVNTFTGISYYYLQDHILSMEPWEKQQDFRGRFLFEGSYFNSGCRYDLTNVENQPIIEADTGKFYNPGILSIAEYDIELRLLFATQYMISSPKQAQQFYLKKKIMLNIFLRLLMQTLNTEYRSFRQSLNEYIVKDSNSDSDPNSNVEFKQFLREEMLLFVREILRAIKSFINVDEFIEKQRSANIYSDEHEIKKLINQILI
jgi:hypothetical protein